jgi:hypothetical protein
LLADGDEFTLGQTTIHRQFCSLFEELTEGFLRREQGFESMEQFYDLIKSNLPAHNESSSAPRRLMTGNSPPSEAKEQAGEFAEEVMDVVKEVIDFQTWANRLIAQARRRQAFDLERQGEVGVSVL